MQFLVNDVSAHWPLLVIAMEVHIHAFSGQILKFDLIPRNKHFCYLIPHPTPIGVRVGKDYISVLIPHSNPTMGMKVLKHDFVYRYGHVMQILAKITFCLELEVWKVYISVQIWTFHSVLSKNYFVAHWSGHFMHFLAKPCFVPWPPHPLPLPCMDDRKTLYFYADLDISFNS